MWQEWDGEIERKIRGYRRRRERERGRDRARGSESRITEKGKEGERRVDELRKGLLLLLLSPLLLLLLLGSGPVYDLWSKHTFSKLLSNCIVKLFNSNNTHVQNKG